MSELNEHQVKAVDSTCPSIVCVAAPGTGKTRTLAERIAKLLQHLTPRQIVAITFTNAAAMEIQERVNKVVGHKVVLGYAGTVHGFALRLLQEHGHLIGLHPPLAVISPTEQEEILDEIIGLHRFKGSRRSVEEAIKRNPMLDPNETLQGRTELVAIDYHRHLLNNGLLDFNSILSYCLLMLEQHEPDLPYHHLMIDEVQDSSDMQFDIYRALKIRNKFYVGDPRQAIYSFNGGNVHNFHRAIREAGELFHLTTNYRSSQGICDKANRLIAQESNQYPEMTSHDQSLPHVFRVTCFKNELQEKTEIAEKLNHLPLQETAILLRTNWQVEKWREHLQGHGFPIRCRQFKEMPADWAKARQFVSLLCNPDSNVLAFSFVKQFYGQKEAQRVKLVGLATGQSIAEVCNTQEQNLESPTSRIPTATPENVLEVLARHHIGTETMRVLESCVEKLPPGWGIAEFSNALGQEELHDPETGEGVTVTTIHSAKGREWNTVFLPTWAEGILPMGLSPNVKEERRLAYVAVTRAKTQVWITCPAQMVLPYGREPVAVVPSRYINELNPVPGMAWGNEPYHGGQEDTL